VIELDDRTYAVRVLDERDPGGAAEIERLRSAPGTAVRDLYEAQLAEVGGDGEPRWVHYPWRGALVRVLGPEGYRRLRLARNRNKITAGEQAAHATRTVAVAGAGVGHAIVLGLALEGLFGTVRIADGDPVALSDLNQLPGSLVDVGVNRAVALARRIAEVDPYLTVRVHEGLGVAAAGAFVDGADVVLDASDELGVKLALREQARERKIPVLMATPDRGTVDVERFDLDPERLPFHGRFAGFTAEMFDGLPGQALVPFLPRILGGDGISPRMAASMFEIGESLGHWPQLAGDTLQAAAGVVAAVRRLGELPSGRVHLDVAARLDELTEPPVPAELPPFEPVGDWRNLGEPTSDVTAVVRAGQLAPSAGNCQPWRFVQGAGVVRVELDETRTSAIDVAFRASHLAIGAALHNMRVAAAARGVLGDVELFPDTETVAVLRLGTGQDPRLAGGYRPMLARVTNRQPTEPGRTIPDEVFAALTEAAAEHGAGLSVLTEPRALATAGTVLASADRVRYLVPELHREMIGEMRDPRTESVDRGLDVRSLEMGPATPLLDLVRRGDVMVELAGTDDPAARGAQGQALVDSYPALVAVTVPGGTPADYVTGGQAMEAVWIAATAAGLAARPAVPLFLFTHDEAELAAITERFAGELSAMRADLRATFDVAPEHQIAMILLLGYAPPPSAVSLRSAETAPPA
jgi:hypothetical protein